MVCHSHLVNVLAQVKLQHKPVIYVPLLTPLAITGLCLCYNGVNLYQPFSSMLAPLWRGDSRHQQLRDAHLSGSLVCSGQFARERFSTASRRTVVLSRAELNVAKLLFKSSSFQQETPATLVVRLIKWSIPDLWQHHDPESMSSGAGPSWQCQNSWGVLVRLLLQWSQLLSLPGSLASRAAQPAWPTQGRRTDGTTLKCSEYVRLQNISNILWK